MGVFLQQHAYVSTPRPPRLSYHSTTGADDVSDTYDIRTSQYEHPEQRGGPHTNGPAKLFVRCPNGPWYRVRIKTHAHAVRRMIAAYGFDHFVATHCDVVAQEPTT